MSVRDLLTKPSALVPLLLSGLALAFLIGYVGSVGLGEIRGPTRARPRDCSSS
jgi:hypothetical protein